MITGAGVSGITGNSKKPKVFDKKGVNRFWKCLKKFITSAPWKRCFCRYVMDEMLFHGAFDNEPPAAWVMEAGGVVSHCSLQAGKPIMPQLIVKCLSRHKHFPDLLSMPSVLLCHTLHGRISWNCLSSMDDSCQGYIVSFSLLLCFSLSRNIWKTVHEKGLRPYSRSFHKQMHKAFLKVFVSP